MATRPSPSASFEHETPFATFRYADGVLTAKLAGPAISEREATILGRDIGKVLDSVAPLRLFVFDLAQVSVLTSMGLGMCLDARLHARGLGAPTVLYRMRPHIESIFHLTKAGRRFRMVGSERALRRLAAA